MDFWTFRRLACSSVTDPSWTLTLTATGTGAGVATMRVNLSAASSATLNANGHFYTDAAGTLGESQSRSLVSGWNTLYIKVTSGDATLAFADSSLVTMWGSPSSPANQGYETPANAPSWQGACSDLPENLTRFSVYGNGVISGTIPATCPPLTAFFIGGAASASALSGTLYVPSTMTGLAWGAASSSSVSIDLTSGSSLLTVSGAGGVIFTGSINALTACTSFASNTGQPFNCSGDLASFRNSNDIFIPSGTSTLTYTSGTVWGASRSRLYLRSQSFTSTQCDNILIDMAASITTATGSKIINLKGSRTAASDSAYAYLSGLGFTVSVTA